MTFNTPTLDEVIETLISNDKLISVLKENGALITKEKLLNEYHPSVVQQMTIESSLKNIQNMQELANLLLINESHIKEKYIWDLTAERFLFNEIGNNLPRKIQQESRAGNIPYIVMDMLTGLKISLPSFAEQEKIGKYFADLDSLIALHQRKLDKLKRVKSAYLTEMFPAEGEREPKRRFPGFTGAWEQRKFMDLIDSIIDFRGRTPKKLGMNWSNEGLLALSAQNVKDGYIDKTIDAHYGSQTLYDKWMNGRELHKGQVVFTTEAPMGNVARIPDENKYILSQRTIAFTVKNTVLTEGFLMYLLESPSVKNNLLRISSGGTAKGVSQKTLSSLTVKIPTSLKEQERINFVFYSLDSLITLHQRKLDKLQKLKNAYLNEMFV